MTAPSQPARVWVLVALAISCIGVGSAPIFVRLSEVDPSATLMLRMFFASGIIGVFQAFSGPRRVVESANPWSKRRLNLLLLLSSVVFCLDLLANHWAVTFTSVTNTVLLANVAPIFVAVIAFALFNERLSAVQVSSLGLAVLGATVLALDKHGLSFGSKNMLGIWLALLSSAAYAVYLIITKHIRDRIDANTIVLWNSLISALFLVPLVLMTSDPVVPQTATGYITIIALAVVSQVLGHGLMAYALRHVSTGLAAATTLATPVVSAVLAWVVLSEPMTVQQGVGALLILFGLYFYSNPERLQRRFGVAAPSFTANATTNAPSAAGTERNV